MYISGEFHPVFSLHYWILCRFTSWYLVFKCNEGTSHAGDQFHPLPHAFLHGQRCKCILVGDGRLGGVGVGWGGRNLQWELLHQLGGDLSPLQLQHERPGFANTLQRCHTIKNTWTLCGSKLNTYGLWLSGISNSYKNIIGMHYWCSVAFHRLKPRMVFFSSSPSPCSEIELFN